MQIKASQVYCWDDKRDKLELLQADKVYPPSVTFTLEMLESHPGPVNLFIKIYGSTTDDDMDMEIMLPLGLYILTWVTFCTITAQQFGVSLHMCKQSEHVLMT